MLGKGDQGRTCATLLMCQVMDNAESFYVAICTIFCISKYGVLYWADELGGGMGNLGHFRQL